jgi:hypothetical protein
MSKRRLIAVALSALPLAAACGGGPAHQTQAPPDMNPIAEQYVKLVLALGQHDADYVDAYYGPPQWRKEAEATKLPLDEIVTRASALQSQLEASTPPVDGEELILLRHRYLQKQLSSLRSRAEMLAGARLSFDEESKALYDAVAPALDEAHFEQILSRLEARLPGKSPLVDRWDAYRSAFVIPAAKLDAVFRAAIDECRRRTLDQIELPDTESFTVEYVTKKPWSAYNWYQGQFRSVIQVNTDLPVYVDRAIDLACHEGYPGHHVYNALLEGHLVRDRGWIEYSVYPLFSPQSLIAEGTANFGIDVAFPGNERVAFEKTALFSLAGLDASRAAEYGEVVRLVEELAYARNEAARRFRNGAIDRVAAIAWLERYAMMPGPRAEQSLRFIERYGAYVINYNLGKDLVKAYVEKHGGTVDQPLFRWREFERLISSPRLPSGLR